MKTIIVLSHQPKNFGDRQFHHGDELPPDLLPAEAVDRHLDRGELVEFDPQDRRSLYRLFSSFSGCSESERLSREELAELALPE